MNMLTSNMVPAPFFGLRDFFDAFDSDRDSNSLMPKASVFEDKKAGTFTLDVELPGVKKENLDVRVEGGNLSIKATRKTKESEMTYERSFHLAEDLDTENVKAALNDGVLSCTFSKKKSAEARKLTVE
ncbi:MAG: Hsp20/alpha crystallin family protein [Fibrobacteraceae bacterium]